MSAFPSLPLFTDSFIADTGHLTAQETGAYLMLLMMAWRLPECSLPDDDAKLARWARLDARTWRRIKPTVMEFWTLTDGVWTQKRLLKEREIVSKRAEVSRENGKHGGRPKSLKSNDQDNPAGSSRVTQKKAPNPNPIEDAETIVSDAAASDPKAVLFSKGLDYLASTTGKPAAKCRPLMGQWLSRSGNDAGALLSLLSQARRENVADPVSWIERRLRGPPQRTAKRNGALEAWDRAIEDERHRERTDAPQLAFQRG